MQKDLFFSERNGAEFSECRKYRYALWRIWDEKLPLVMFVGLNPSTANETEVDNTIKSVIRISKSNGFGGFYMMNCFPYVSTDPDQLRDFGNTALNDHWLYQIGAICKEIIFAWGAFKVVKDLGRDIELAGMFPTAKALEILKDGSPKHPLYCKGSTLFVNFNLRKNHQPIALRAFLEEHFDYSWLKKTGIYSKDLKRNDYEGQAKRLCEWWGLESIYDYGKNEVRCHINYAGPRPVTVNEKGELKPTPFVEIINSNQMHI